MLRVLLVNCLGFLTAKLKLNIRKFLSFLYLLLNLLLPLVISIKFQLYFLKLFLAVRIQYLFEFIYNIFAFILQLRFTPFSLKSIIALFMEVANCLRYFTFCLVHIKKSQTLLILKILIEL